MKFTTRLTNVLLALLCVGLIAGVSQGCASTTTSIVQSGAEVVPTESLQDLVTYGDVAVVFEVTSEATIPPGEDEVRRGEGTITRQVRARQIGEPLWVRPTRDKTAPGPTKEWTISDGGWIFHDGNVDNKVRLEVGGRLPLVVGQRYLAVRTYSSFGGETESEWFSLRYIPLKDGRIVIDKSRLDGPADADFDTLQGRSTSDFTQTLIQTDPDSRLANFMHLDAAQRYQKLFE